jgi:hypothetical protein
MAFQIAQTRELARSHELLFLSNSWLQLMGIPTSALEGKDSPPLARAPEFSIRSQPLVVFFEKLKVVRAAATGTSTRSAPASPAAFFNIT